LGRNNTTNQTDMTDTLTAEGERYITDREGRLQRERAILETEREREIETEPEKKSYNSYISDR